ncbi:hypothetical protein GGR28_002953 [Lewinella aquimaris]|uniref:3'-5' exoribonuclease Rv2179c-like domain-containing protein n=1 Tax=Neolewinella aquimaris TaxID=1835722 RepID=A0A840EEU0_9BACT|nr:3'-5' exoribonuclease [Neolewinella aquimaris]MBB4080319.1 hypothetical protein [Neolewinella aquimaris]
MSQLFLDTEFTGLHQHARLISLALVPNEGPWFYAVFDDVDKGGLTEWHQSHVVPHLELTEAQLETLGPGTYLVEDTSVIVAALRDYLASFETIEMWADVPAYDWVLFCELFGGALQLPRHVHYMVRDLATLFEVKGYDIDTDRFAFAYGGDAGATGTGDGRADLVGSPGAAKVAEGGLVRHNALGDALGGRACFKKLR